jgi:succinate dehydrogenase / fumarate reductase flavoprotein subunit
MAFKLDSKIPAGELAQKWSNHKAAIKVVSPANKRKLDIIVVGTGLGGASAAASLGELGYNVKVFCIQDSPRRAHSIAAQGGINAAKNYRNDNDSIYRLFYDTIKGGDYRAREANVYRMAEVSNCIIDQCVGQGVPFAREYGGMLDNRSFGGAQVSRTFYARGQTGQQLLLGAYAALNKEIAAGSVKSYPRHEMLDIVIEDGEARGIIARNLVTGELERFGARRSDRFGRLRQRVLPFDQRDGFERFGRFPVLPQGCRLRESLFHADPPDLYSGARGSAVEADPNVGVAA